MTDSPAPALRFGAGDMSGFNAAGLEGFHDLKPEAVVRELVQNSLDAAQEAGREVAHVRFEVGDLPCQDIPGIAEYRRVFHRAVKDQKRKLGELPDAAQAVASAMESALAESQHQVLYVLDNGIGLNEARMEGLLADGLSVKGSSAAGAVGNGHLVAIPASDLRYVLYGGVSGDDTICSGHAVIASHESARELRSKDGFYVKRLTGEFQRPYQFATGTSEVPAFIMEKLEWIQQNWPTASGASGTGAVVAITAFNNFRETTALWEMVSKAVACNFFAALNAGKLLVEVVAKGKTRTLSSTNVFSELGSFKEEKRTRSGFISGSAAFRALETLFSPQALALRVEQEKGSVAVQLRETEPGQASRIDLCRNGMWITNALPGLDRSKFSDNKPFHCVILLDADAGRIHSIVRKAEGPLHNGLTKRKWLSKEEKKILRETMRSIEELIREHIGKYDSEHFFVQEILNFETGGDDQGGQIGVWKGAYEPMPAGSRRLLTDGGGGGGGGGGGNSTPSKLPKRSRRLGFRALFVPGADDNAGTIKLIPTEDAKVVAIQFVLDESLDESCDYRASAEHIVALQEVKLNGADLAEEAKMFDSQEQFRAIRLEDVRKGKRIEIDFSYQPPSTGKDQAETWTVLKAELLKAEG